MAKVVSKLLTCEFDGSLCIFNFTAEVDGSFAVGSIPVKDVIEAIGHPVALEGLVAGFRTAVAEGFLDLASYRARSWSPWAPASGTSPRFSRLRPPG